MCHLKKKDIFKPIVYDARWFKKMMLNYFVVAIKATDVGYESLFLEHEEVDEHLIPVEDIQSLPNPLLIHSFLYVQPKNDDEWLCIIVTNEENQSILYERWFKNNQEVFPRR